MTVITITDHRQAHALTELSQAAADLLNELEKVGQAVAEQTERAKAGHHLSGFEGDLFGQARYKADGAAVRRAVLIRTAWMIGCTEEQITEAIMVEKEYGRYSGKFYTVAEGEWRPTHQSNSDGSTVRLVSASPFVIENEDGESWEDDPTAWSPL